MPVTFITGPVRSGKSRFAASLAASSGRTVTFVATARRDANDAEWDTRIERHRLDRPSSWRTIETATESITLAGVVANAAAGDVLLVDSLGTWLADELFKVATTSTGNDDEMLATLCTRLIDALARTRAHVILVSEETGWGIVPEHPSGRLFRDLMGRLNAELAMTAERAYLVVCGYALDIKSGISIASLA